MINVQFKKVSTFLIIGILIGFTPAYAIQVSESYPTIDPMDLKGKGIGNATTTSLQSSNYTCGPAALAIVSKNFGVNTSEKELAILAGTDESGTTMGGLVHAAQEKGLNAAALNLKVDELKSNNIALVTINGTPHYTVVKETTPDGFLLSDPSLGNVKISKEDFANIYSGYALIVNSDDLKKINQDLEAFSKKSELTYTEFLKAYESLKQNLSRLEKAYDSGDGTKIKDALTEYNQSKENFFEIKNQLILLKQEEEALGGKIISFIERAVISGTYPSKLLDEAKKNNDALLKNSEEFMLKISNLIMNIESFEDIERLKTGIYLFDEFLNSMNEKSPPDTTSITKKSIESFDFKGEEIVNPSVNKILSEIEEAIGNSKEELDRIEVIYNDLLTIKDKTVALKALKDDLSSIKEKTKKEVSQEDIENISSIKNDLSALLIEIDNIMNNIELASTSINKLSEIKSKLRELYKLTHHIDEISPEYNQKAAILKQDISDILDRIDVDFKYTWYCWYLLGDGADELKKTENELKGIEQNLKKAGRKENLYQDIIEETKRLEKSSSDLRSFILMERGEIKSLSQDLRHMGAGWVKIYREFVDLVPPLEIDPVYLNETIDARITPEIRQKALELGYDPTQIYNFVQSLSYETYFGSLRGSLWTLSAGAGNDFDKASLLVALLRASGCPARYVHGWIETDPSTLIELLEGKSVTVDDTTYAMTIDQALNVLRVNRIPYEKKENTVAFEHVWVEVAIPSKETKKTTKWSFEDLEFENMNLDKIGIPAIKSIKEIQVGYYWLPLDPSLSSYTVLQAINYPEIPDELRHKVQIKTSDGIDSGMIPLPLLAKEKIILKYEPADEGQAAFLGDQSLYRLLDNGGKSWYVGLRWGDFWWIGPYYAYVIPKLIIGNQTISVGNVTVLGSRQTLEFNFTYANLDFMQNLKGYLAGDAYSITLSPAYEPSSRIREEAEKTTTLKQEYDLTSNPSTYDDMVGQLLYTSGITYYAACDKTDELLQEVFITKAYNPITRCDYVSMGARYWETLYGFWGIYRVYANYRPGAISHDVPIWIISSYSKIGQEEGRVLYHLKSGFAGSGWESQSIYGLFNVEAVSTTYILAYAQSQGIPVYVINQENLYEILPKLKVASWIKNWIIANVNAGHQVIIPEQELTIGQWRGTGWASIDENGLGAYIITGGLYEALYGGYGTEAMNMDEIAEALVRNYIPFVSLLDSGDVSKKQEAFDALITALGIVIPIVIRLLGGTVLSTILIGLVPFGFIWMIGVALGTVYPWIEIALALLALGIAVYLTYRIIMDPNGEIIVQKHMRSLNESADDFVFLSRGY